MLFKVFPWKQWKAITVGFTRQSKRQFKIWDTRNLDKCIKTQDLDQASGVIMPHFDDSNNVLYLAGKGDGNIRYFEITDAAPSASVSASTALPPHKKEFVSYQKETEHIEV